VDTLGLLLQVLVTAAGVTDREAATTSSERDDITRHPSRTAPDFTPDQRKRGNCIR
jgi:hypothetical protein